MANIPVLMNWREIKRVLNFIASCYILIGEKLHSIVFSAAAHTPFIAIEYRPKCRDFAETMGFGKYIIRTDEITSKRVMEMFLDLLNNWDEMYEKLLKNVQFYREKLIKFAKLIKRILR